MYSPSVCFFRYCFLVQQVSTLLTLSIFLSVLDSCPVISTPSSQSSLFLSAPTPTVFDHSHDLQSFLAPLPPQALGLKPESLQSFSNSCISFPWILDPPKILSHIQPALQRIFYLILVRNTADIVFPFCLIRIHYPSRARTGQYERSQCCRWAWTCTHEELRLFNRWTAETEEDKQPVSNC